MIDGVRRFPLRVMPFGDRKRRIRPDSLHTFSIQDRIVGRQVLSFASKDSRLTCNFHSNLGSEYGVLFPGLAGMVHASLVLVEWSINSRGPGYR